MPRDRAAETPVAQPRSGRPRSEPPKSTRTRETILQAAAQVLADRGWAGTHLADIADLAAVAAPAIYYYWPSREELLEEVVTVGQQATLDHVLASLEALPTGSTAMDRIASAVAAHLEVVLTRSSFSRAAIRNLGQLPADIRDRQLVGQRAYAEVWRSLIDRAVTAGEMTGDVDSRAARMLVIGALNWAPEWWNPERSSLEQVIATTQRIVLHGIRPR